MERTPVTDTQEVWLGGKPFTIMGDVGEELSNIFSRKVNQGDPGPDDHPTFSTSIQRDWSGGALVREGNPASDQGRFDFSTCETGYPGAITLPPLTHEYINPEGVTSTDPGYVIGDFNDRLYLAWGTNLYMYNYITDDITFVGDMGSSPSAVGNGTVYLEQYGNATGDLVMFIPLITGYCVLGVDNVITPGPDTIRVVDFEVWDNKIWKYDAEGSLFWSDIIPTTSADWTRSCGIPDGSHPTRLISFMDKSGNPCLFLVTDRTTWKHDFANNMLHKDDLEFPQHPAQGRAAVNYRGVVEISVGTGIHRYDNNTISAAGLDSRNGLPPEYRGVIVDMEGTYNGLYALIHGMRTSSETVADEHYTLDLGGGGDQFYSPDTASNNLLMIDTGFGWGYRWHGQGDPPTNIKVSNVQNRYAIWWGANRKIHRQNLSRIQYEPADVDTRGSEFAQTCTHLSSWNGWGWVNQDKIMKQIEIAVRRLAPGCSVEVAYQIDVDTNPWITLPIITTNGRHRFYVGQDTSEPVLRGGRGHYKGVRHEKYRLRIILKGSGAVTDSPVIEWHAVVARRWLRPQRTWRLQLDLSEKTKDWPVQAQYEHIFQIATNQEAVVFQVNDEQYMVELVMDSGPRKSGRDKRRLMNITLMEANDLDRFGRA